MGFDLMRISLILVVLGALNCASMGLMRNDFISTALGRGTFGKAVHLLIGVAAIMIALKMFGFMEGFENNMNSNNMNYANNSNGANNTNGGNNMNSTNMEGFYACKDCTDPSGKPCVAQPAVQKPERLQQPPQFQYFHLILPP